MPTINQAYEWMQQLIQQSFPEASALGGIKLHLKSVIPIALALRFKHSRKKKLPGIAQRRLKDVGLCVLYLSVFGDQHYRGQVVRDFL